MNRGTAFTLHHIINMAYKVIWTSCSFTCGVHKSIFECLVERVGWFGLYGGDGLGRRRRGRRGRRRRPQQLARLQHHRAADHLVLQIYVEVIIRTCNNISYFSQTSAEILSLLLNKKHANNHKTINHSHFESVFWISNKKAPANVPTMLYKRRA